jgi:hypothetical protein
MVRRGAGGYLPPPPFLISVDSKWLKARDDVSVDCEWLKVLCFERAGLELVSVDFNSVKVLCFATLSRIFGSADSKEVSNATEGLGGFGFRFTWKITIEVYICQGNSCISLKGKEIGAGG